MTWSILKFTGEEIIGLAVNIEKAGKTFYEKALNKVDDADAREMFSYLAREEEKHMAAFEKLGAKLAKEVVPNESYVGEYGDYLKSIIDTHVFNQNNVDDLVKDIKTFREALAIAFRFEKDSIIIFQEFLSSVDSTGKEIIGELIAEEKEHIKKISKLNRIS
ncbi:MAG: rubrerythrin [Peptococcaceae bacterium BRH_c4a]|nr:MAG: rubrerythrin [Peptococcaceae bacterium BRH_c4a]